MFFISTIKSAISDYKTKKKAERLSKESLRRYFDSGKKIHEALKNADQIIGSTALGVKSTEVSGPPTYEYMITYNVDEHLTAIIRRFVDLDLEEKLTNVGEPKVKGPFANVGFKIDGMSVQYPEHFDELCQKTLDSIADKIKSYRDKAHKKLEAYFDGSLELEGYYRDAEQNDVSSSEKPKRNCDRFDSFGNAMLAFENEVLGMKIVAEPIKELAKIRLEMLNWLFDKPQNC